MPQMINVADLKDPNGPEGRTYREVNKAKEHAIPLKTLVEIITWDEESEELYGGVRIFVVSHTRDCDGTPLYTLAPKSDTTPTGYGTARLGSCASCQHAWKSYWSGSLKIDIALRE